jgi:hypothetical protein
MVAIAATATAQQPKTVRTVPIQPAPIGEMKASGGLKVLYNSFARLYQPVQLVTKIHVGELV